MDSYDIAYAREHLEELIARARRGEEVTIVDPHVGRARLSADRAPDVTAPRVTDTMEPFVPLKEPRKPGRLKGTIPPPPDDFFDPLTEEELKDWYGDNP